MSLNTATAKDGGLACYNAPERSSRSRIGKDERQHENPQHTAVEQGSHDVHRFDQRAEASAEARERDRITAPENGRDTRGENILRVRRFGRNVALVNIDHAHRRQRIDLSRYRRHAGGKNDRDHQTDDPHRQIVRDEPEKNVVGVVQRTIAGSNDAIFMASLRVRSKFSCAAR